ncbi:MAG: RNA polymerase sigma factor [Anaerolineales bacterium]|nr:RNA polymerase sigma factor [Anaerolineales bacterium]
MLDLKTLYSSYAAHVYRFALWLAGNRQEAEDITSETFVRAWAHKSTVRTETLKAYLFTIARNVYLERQRKEKRQVDLDDFIPSSAPGPESVVESKLLLHRVRTLLLDMPEIDRTAFVLRVQHELDYAEIARILSLSLICARVKVHRVRKRLLLACMEKVE